MSVEVVIRIMSLFFGIILIFGTLWVWPYLDAASRALPWSALVLIVAAVLPPSVLQPKANIMVVITSLVLFLTLLVLTNSSRSLGLSIWVILLHIGWVLISMMKIRKQKPL